MSIIKLAQSDKFRGWLNKINEIIEVLNKATDDILGKAQKKHNSVLTDYGAGNSTEYGHVKLSDSTNDMSNNTNGIAATPFSVKIAYDKAIDALTLAENLDAVSGDIGKTLNQIQTDLTNKAPTKHSSNQTIYGVGSALDYGHVKLTTDLTSESDSSGGIAVAPLAVKTVNDNLVALTEIVEKKANTSHKSQSDEHGVGNETEYGHVKLSDDVTLNQSVESGIAATIGSVKMTYDLANQADINASDALLSLEEKAPINHASTDTIYGIGNDIEYGHVRVTDDVDLDSDANEGVVPSAGALRETYLKASEAYDMASELKITGGSGSAVTTLLTDKDLNTVVMNGVYITEKSSLLLNYPYEGDVISVLEVNSVITSLSTIIKQRLYSNNSLYVRDSYDGGASWDDWEILSKSNSTEQVEIYVSSEFGSDNNSGFNPDSPISSTLRLIELINIQSAIASNKKDTSNIKVYFDKGTYDDSMVFMNVPMSIEFTSYYMDRGDTTEDQSKLDENKPYFPKLVIINSRVSLSGLKIDTLYAQENSIVILENYNYISVGCIKSYTGSTVFISSIYTIDNAEVFPLRIHNTDTNDNVFNAYEYGCIYDVESRVIHFDSDVVKQYLFACMNHGEISLPNITFTYDGNLPTMTQYAVMSYGSLIHPDTLMGDATNNVIEENTYLQGVLWGGGSNTKYLRADGTWQTPPDTNTTYTASNGIKLTGTNFTNTGVTSFNGSTGAVTYSAPVTSVNGKTGAVTVNVPVTSVNGQTGAVIINSDGITGDDIFISTSKSVTLPSGGTWAVIMQSTGDNKDQSTCGTYSGGSSITLSNYGGGSFILGIRIAD